MENRRATKRRRRRRRTTTTCATRTMQHCNNGIVCERAEIRKEPTVTWHLSFSAGNERTSPPRTCTLPCSRCHTCRFPCTCTYNHQAYDSSAAMERPQQLSGAPQNQINKPAGDLRWVTLRNRRNHTFRRQLVTTRLGTAAAMDHKQQ